jgi:superfamily II DNA or RNA helicase
MLKGLKENNYKMLLMSATAATNPLDMRSFGYATGLHNFKNFPTWVKDMGAFVNIWGHYQIDVNEANVMKRMGEIHETLFDSLKVASRMVRESFGDIFPKNKVNTDPVSMGRETKGIDMVYNQMEAELARLEERAGNYSSHHFAVMMEARRKVELLKVPTMIEHLKSMYENNISPVLFVNFNETVSAIKNRLGSLLDVTGYIVGSQTDKQRKRDIDQFNSDDKRIMLVNLRAGNAGISLHDLNGKYPRHSIISPSFSAIDIKQAMGRIHRAEAKTPTVQNIMFAANTIEERACKRVASKLNNLSMLNDHDLTPDIVFNR